MKARWLRWKVWKASGMSLKLRRNDVPQFAVGLVVEDHDLQNIIPPKYTD